MKRQQVLLAAAIVGFTVGCNTPTPRFDPFLGRTTVPPPATGHIVSPIPGTTDPYYPPGTTTAPGAAVQTAPGAVVPRGSTNSQSIPITSQQQGSLKRRRGDSLVSKPSATNKRQSDVVQAAHTSEIRIVEPVGAESQTKDPDEPRRFQAAADAAPITSRSRLANAKTGAATRSSDFGFARDYGWLQGTLEYSQSDRRWKLRYIPIDGVTDGYGGSVLLPDSADMANFQPGDIVRVEGQVASGRSEDTGFAPLYRYSKIDHLADG